MALPLLMNRRRRNSLLTLIVLAAAGTGMALYAQNTGFTESWRKLIEEEFAKRGYIADVGKLTLGPIQGLVAEEVKFYQERSLRTEIASIDRAILDVDLRRILEKELSLNSIDFQRANISLPIDPTDPNSQRLEIQDFSARAVFSAEDIEIVHASAAIHGLPVTLKGRIHRPPMDLEEDSKTKSKAKAESSDDDEALAKKERARARREQLKKISERLRLFGEILAQLEQFEFLPAGPDRGVDLAINGDLADTSSLQVSCEIELGAFRRSKLDFGQLSSLIEFNGSRLSVRELILRDSAGELRLSAEWPISSAKVHFGVDSSLDLSRIATTLSRQAIFGEVVFFTPPQVRVEGDWYIGDHWNAPHDWALADSAAPPQAPAPAPLRLFPSWPDISGVGSVSCDRFTSRGVVFDGFKTELSFAADRFYLRNLRLDHKTGLAQAHIMFDPEEGFRHQAEIKFDPRTLLPFVKSPEVRRQLNRWSFSDASTVYIGFEGAGPQLDRRGWVHEGVIDLRNCSYNGVAVGRLESSFESRNGYHRFDQLRIQGGGGETGDDDEQAASPGDPQKDSGNLTATQVLADIGGGRLKVDALLSDLPFPDLVRLAAPQLEGKLSALHFSGRPQVGIHGQVDLRQPEALGDGERLHDLRIGFDSDESLDCQIFGHTLRAGSPSGTLLVRGSTLVLSECQAELFGGELSGGLNFPQLLSDDSEIRGTGDFVLSRAHLFDSGISPTGRALAERPVSDMLAGAKAFFEMPVELSADFSFQQDRVSSDNLILQHPELEGGGKASVELGNLAVDAMLRFSPRLDGSPATNYHLQGTLLDPKWTITP